MYTDNFVMDLQTHQGRLLELQRQSASGKRILSPSDDPVGAQEVTVVKAAQAATTQFLTNVSAAKALVDHTYSVVNAAGQAVDDAIVAANRGANDTMAAVDRKALATTVNQLLEGALDSANDSTQGRYTFSGTHSATPPYVATRDASGNITGVTLDPTVTADAVNRQVDSNNVLKVNLNGPDIFGGAGSPAGSTDYFATLIQLRDALKNNDSTAVRALIPQVQSLHDQVFSQAALAGSSSQRLDSVQSKLESQQLELAANRSRLEDVDIARAAVDLQTEQNTYQAALAVGSKILSLNLNQLLTG
jgi:flagellar hook-associated protein 3 FlgL